VKTGFFLPMRLDRANRFEAIAENRPAAHRPLERFPAKWIPVHVKKARKTRIWSTIGSD
jgi:hypothetical protein